MTATTFNQHRVLCHSLRAALRGPLIPAKAGIQHRTTHVRVKPWVPARPGMTQRPIGLILRSIAQQCVSRMDRPFGLGLSEFGINRAQVGNSRLATRRDGASRLLRMRAD